MLAKYCCCVILTFCSSAFSQTLEKQLLNEAASVLADAARQEGNAQRGAILFHQVHVGCVKCHAMDGSSNSLGPDLTLLSKQKDATDEHIVTSLLLPSAAVRKDYQSVTIVTTDGRTLVGLLADRTDTFISIRDPAKNGERFLVPMGDVDDVIENKLSIMPAGLVNQLGSRQQFLDLLRYVLDVRDGGVNTARKLQPAPGTIAFSLPEYESHVDHAGLIRKLDDDAFERGEKIYSRLCINCHGDQQKPGSLPTALRFAEGKFRSGGDPYTMYQTLTHGFGLMVPQTWMVPQQKYDVIHYIRESYVKKGNAAQYVATSDDYLISLPKGNTFGPEPVDYAPWSDMNYGPSMINTFEVGSDGTNFAYKGIAIRLDQGPGGVSRGNRWAIFDHDTMRMAAAWIRNPAVKEAGFINWQGIHFDGRHGTHPRIVGDVLFSNPTGPGWAKPGTSEFEDDQRVVGRDAQHYGPLPRSWAKYTGLHTLADQTIIEYTVGDRRILERLGAVDLKNAGSDDLTVFTRTMSFAAAESPQLMLVATHSLQDTDYRRVGKYSAVMAPRKSVNKPEDTSDFNGASYLRIHDAATFNMTTNSFTIAARIRTSADGVIFSKCSAEGPWVPGGKAFFIRDGRLTYDIGWVGAAISKERVDDGQWHYVAMNWDHKTGCVSFFIDGKPNGSGYLTPKLAADDRHVAKIGFAADNFPATSYFNGNIEHLAFFDRVVSDLPVNPEYAQTLANASPVAMWSLGVPSDSDHNPLIAIHSASAQPISAEAILGTGSLTNTAIFAGIVGTKSDFAFSSDENRLLLTCPRNSDSENVVLWTASVPDSMTVDDLRALEAQIQDRSKPDDLPAQVTTAAKARWPEVLTTTPVIGSENGPFAIDVLSPPTANPWLARLRLTGHDFFDDGKRAAVCCWDGDVWMVSGLNSLRQSHKALPSEDLSSPLLIWQRIASGLFQPLGLKIVDGTIYVTCRDQLVILRDHNGDGETDFYECFNNDHQVTPHFHEFAMGLQRDGAGNFYYAKSARHALKAVVPHHGTLLRIPPDGSRTDIVANGFRAANGVCLNPDGSFIVTDQEGHWNPKNRINWVREGGFYGNMFGYHDVTDDSDEAMEQPLCWITNAFDRSPAELMWIKNESWGPLNGTLLNFSYGYGKVYVVPHEQVSGQMQGGMCELPIPQFPTGITRGRISPYDNGLYLSGMFAWGSSQQIQEGGFYRIRPTGQPSFLPVGLRASRAGVVITFSDPVKPDTALNSKNYSVKVWSLRRTANYGSKHYDEHQIDVAGVTISDDHRTITLSVPDLAPTWCMEISCRLKSPEGEDFERVIHNTIHHTD